MAWIPDELKKVADEVENGQSSSVRTRKLLSWFGAQRRGHVIVSIIRRALKETGLRTEPTFEYAYIDGDIQFLPIAETAD
jgi:hypothetical protein